MPVRRGMGDSRVASPIIYEGRRWLALRHRTGAKRRVGGWRSDPNERSRCAEHGGLWTCVPESCARPTGGSHVRTTEAFTLLTSIGIPLENTNTVRGRNAKAAPGTMGENQRGQGHYRGRSPKAPAR